MKTKQSLARIFEIVYEAICIYNSELIVCIYLLKSLRFKKKREEKNNIVLFLSKRRLYI